MTDATTENAPFAFVRKETLAQETPPLSVAGPIAWVRANLFSGPVNSILTLLCVYIVVTTVPEMVRFYFIDAVWSGTNRDACLADKVGRPVGACWAYIADRFQYFIYGSYPVPQRWRVNIVFAMFALGVVWLLWERAPLKKVGLFFFFVILPISAYVLLLGGPTAEGFLRWLIPHLRADGGLSRAVLRAGPGAFLDRPGLPCGRGGAAALEALLSAQTPDPALAGRLRRDRDSGRYPEPCRASIPASGAA
jgi:hypothetical protein